MTLGGRWGGLGWCARRRKVIGGRPGPALENRRLIPVPQTNVL